MWLWVLLTRCSQSYNSSGHRCSGAWFQVWGGCSGVSGLVVSCMAQDVSLCARAWRPGLFSWEPRHLSRNIQGQGSIGQRCNEGQLWLWGGCFQVSGASLSESRPWNVLPQARVQRDAPPVLKPDVHLSGGRQGQGSGCQICGGGWLLVWGCCLLVSLALLSGVGAQVVFKMVDPTVANLDIQLSRSSQGKGSSGQRYSRG